MITVLKLDKIISEVQVDEEDITNNPNFLFTDTDTYKHIKDNREDLEITEKILKKLGSKYIVDMGVPIGHGIHGFINCLLAENLLSGEETKSDLDEEINERIEYIREKINMQSRYKGGV